MVVYPEEIVEMANLLMKDIADSKRILMLNWLQVLLTDALN